MDASRRPRWGWWLVAAVVAPALVVLALLLIGAGLPAGWVVAGLVAGTAAVVGGFVLAS